MLINHYQIDLEEGIESEKVSADMISEVSWW
jgi:hypothetical protein